MGINFGLQRRRAEISNTKNDEGLDPFSAAFKFLALEKPKYQYLQPMFLEDDQYTTYNYFAISYYENIYGVGQVNMGTDVHIFKALIY